MLLNLIGNAIKFTHAGEVAIGITRDDDSSVPTALRFTVRDTGIGIPSEKLERVFERFTQADSSTTRRFGGSGLGLTICRRLVELMGGRIWVESRVGEGSVFSFVAPFEIWTGVAARTPRQDSAVMDAPLPPLRILMAEDSPDNCTIVIAYLEATPYQVDVAATGAIACDMFAGGHYDLVLMDRQMPVMDGLTATRHIREWEQAHGRLPTPIIALTASALKGDREKCLAAGCTAFLTKPIRQEVLLQAILQANNERVVAPTPEPVPAPTPVPAPPRIAAFPGLIARIPAFLVNRREDVVTMLKALSTGDFATVQRIGHNMKGAGASFGFQPITDIGEGIEREATGENSAASIKWVDELRAFLDRIGEGPEFMVRAPIVTIDDDATVIGSPLLAADGPRNIVLVEDQVDLRGLMRGILEIGGHHVVDSGDGIDGLALILAEKPDIAIVDIGLPGMDGYEVARRVRAALGNKVVLIALTGRSSDRDRIDALAAGFDAHIVKPADSGVGTALMEQMLQTKRLPSVPSAA